MNQKKLVVALVGLGFGGSFVNIYKDHPLVGKVGIFDVKQDLVDAFLMEHSDDKDQNAQKIQAYQSFEEILADPEIDAVHLVTPIPLHAKQTIQVLEAGKHCACTVPMATSLEDIKAINTAVRISGKNYMMMETTLYTYQFFYVRELIRTGSLGNIQFLRGCHYQDMLNWPDYWLGLPPMWYGTHAIAPMTVLSGTRIKRVNCFGSGTMEESLTKQYQNPFPVESALFEFENGLKGEATRSLFAVARPYQEGMFVYGTNQSFEWGFTDGDNPYVSTNVPVREGCRGATATVDIVPMPNYHHLLPESIQKYTVGKNFDPLNPQDSLKKGSGGGHHGSHPHLVHEFVMSILEDRKPWIDEVLASNITAAGVCAHLSALANGAAVEVPLF